MEFFEFLDFLEAEALELCAKFEAFFSSELLEMSYSVIIPSQILLTNKRRPMDMRL